MTDAVTGAGALIRFEREAGLPPGFCVGLLREHSDWAFVIKLPLTEAVLKGIGQPMIEGVISRLYVNTKVRLACGLGLLTADSVKFLEALGTLRNRLAHDIRQVNDFTLPGYEASPRGANPRHLFGDWVTSPRLENWEHPHRVAMGLNAINVLADLHVIAKQRAEEIQAQQDAIQRHLASERTDKAGDDQ